MLNRRERRRAQCALMRIGPSREAMSRAAEAAQVEVDTRYGSPQQVVVAARRRRRRLIAAIVAGARIAG